ncbi:hypothetical protein DRN85_01395 [Methanosarcinales archaeon]|nr:MAG: hypothetical protein DRN85_01395 [Methanosarcinales archaeon]
MEDSVISSREEAPFEAGIKLGALYHQFTCTPISLATLESVEKAMEESVSLQPFVTSVRVKIDREKVKSSLNEFGYCELDGDMLDVRLTSQVDRATVTAKLSYDNELEYPLMKIVSIDDER